MPTLNELKDFSTQVRRDIVRMVNAVNSGHPGGSLGCTEFMTALYQDVMDYSNNFDMDGKGEDLFFLSVATRLIDLPSPLTAISGKFKVVAAFNNLANVSFLKVKVTSLSGIVIFFVGETITDLSAKKYLIACFELESAI